MVIPDMMSWQGKPVDIVTTTGKDPEPDALEWLKEFGMQQNRPFIYQLAGQWNAFGPPAFQQLIKDKLSRGEAIW